MRMMMTVPMDNSVSPASRELVQRLYKKNIELENGLRKSAKSKVPSDPNVWLQMRENYETIVLEDHEFSEQHDVEISLWQLHYRRIEEFRSHMNAAPAATSTNTSEGGNGKAVNRLDRVKKIRVFFKSFLSEATGFYHELMQKLRSKYGLPLGYFTEFPESQVISANDEKKSVQLKKGLLSCHRCLIYLGDLARYKGLYGDGDSTLRDYAAASSYYVQATGLWPSNGNPHHQLAILASYSGDELVALYRYFRSLAVENPFTTARDNLIIAFEKNRQNYSQLPGSNKIPPVKTMPIRLNGRGRGRGRGDNILPKDGSHGSITAKEKTINIPEVYKTFSTRFVRLNGILYTRTSLETFEDNFSLVTSGLDELLSSGPKEELNFGKSAAENALLILRLITILIFTVHNVKKESDGQSYAEILQRSVLLQSAFIAAFEFVGHIVKRCSQLNDISSSYLLSGVMVFMEWLACNPQVASGDDDEKQSFARSFFWNNTIKLLNKLVLSGYVSVNGDEDEVCFSNMGTYKEEETENRLALWEDFELRGFTPLAPAQLILDFSSKHSLGSDGSKKERKSRIQRIFSAGKSIMDIIRVDQQKISFDTKQKKFVIGSQFAASELNLSSALSDISIPNNVSSNSIIEEKIGNIKSNMLSYPEEEDEEVIVFKPAVVEKNPVAPIPPSYDDNHPISNSTSADMPPYTETLPSAVMVSSTMLNPVSFAHAQITDVRPYSMQHSNTSTSKWFMEQDIYLSDGRVRNTNINENGYSDNVGSQEGSTLQSNAFGPFAAVRDASVNGVSPCHIKASNLDPVLLQPARVSKDMTMNCSTAVPANVKKNPVCRPVRHSGPPPGFAQVPAKQPDHTSSMFGFKEQDPMSDDYSWLDGYTSPSIQNPLIGTPINQTANISYPNSGNTGSFNVTSFPFPGIQIPKLQSELVNSNEWKDPDQLFENLKICSGKQIQVDQFNGPGLEQYQAQRPSRYYF